MGRKIKKSEIVKKDKHTANAESNAAHDAAKSVLSKELLAEDDYAYGHGGASNAAVLPSKRKADDDDDGDDAVEQEPKRRKLTAKRRKQLERVVAKKKKKAIRADLLESLAKSALDPSQMAMLRPTARLGQGKETAKDRMRRRLQEERAGIAGDDDQSRLYKKHTGPIVYEDVGIPGTKKKSAGDDASSDGSDSSGDEESGNDEDAMEVDVADGKGGAKGDKVTPAAEVYPTGEMAARTAAARNERPVRTPITAEDRIKAFYVNVKRDAKVQEGRLQLPILAEEQRIMEAIRENDVVVICGETGSGKTTQVPQFLYEAGYGSLSPESPHKGMIGITEPRRVAAISMAGRVAKELNLPQKEVSYQIRYEATAGASTSIKFMTDGVLLKEIESDFLLQKYSAIIIDEAHERSVNTDVLIGLLSRIVPLRAKLCAEDKRRQADLAVQLQKEKEAKDKEALRAAAAVFRGKPSDKPKHSQGNVITGGNSVNTSTAGAPTTASVQPLKLIIMSATLRVEDFAGNRGLFPTPPPVISVDARQHPVTVHFNKRTELVDYTEEAFKKVCKIHKKLPAGGVLVFVTGQNEVNTLCRKLRQRFPPKQVLHASSKLHGKKPAAPAKIDLDSFSVKPTPRSVTAASSSFGDDSGGLLDDMDADADLDVLGDEDDFTAAGDAAADDYSDDDSDASASEEEVEGGAAPDAEEDGPWGHDDGSNVLVRGGPLFVLPLYSILPSAQQMKVFDAPPPGKRLVVVATNVAETSLTIPNIRYVVDTGRVKQRLHDARTGIASFEIGWTSRASADQRAGRAGRTGPGHCYRLYSSAVFGNQFQQFSDPEILRMPIDGLVLQMRAMGIDNPIGFPFPTPPEKDALIAADNLLRTLGAIDSMNGRVTDVGRRMAKFPLAPRYSRMVATGLEDGLVAHVIAMVAALTVGEIYAYDSNDAEAEAAMDDADDDEVVIRKRRLGAAAKARAKFATEGTDSDVLGMLRAVGAWEYSGGTEEFCGQNGLRHKAMVEIRKLRRQLTDISNEVSLSPSAQLVDLDPKMKPPTQKQMCELRKVILAGFGDRVAKRAPPSDADGKRPAYHSVAAEERVYIHPSSSLLRASPEMIVYHEIIETTRPYMRLITKIDPLWLASIVPSVCTFGKPLENPAPMYDAATDRLRCHIGGTYGPHLWPLPAQAMDYPPCADRYKWFARFLLEGKIVPALGEFTDKLLSQPIVMNKGWAQERIAAILQVLVDAGVHTKAGLVAKWKEDPRYLLQAYSLWVNRGYHAQLLAIWPPVESK